MVAQTLLGKFQTMGFSYYKGLSSKNHMGALFQSAPQKGSNLVVQLLAYQQGKTLDTLLSTFPTKEFDNDEEYTWDVTGSSYRNIPLVEARDENGSIVESAGTMVGAGTAPFYLVFGEDWFADGEYIVGELNEIYQFRILAAARMEGTNAVYKVELAGANSVGVPSERLLSGEKFSIEAAYVEKEMSRKVGDIRFKSSIAMRNEFSVIRIQHKVSGSMLNQCLAVGIPIAKTDASGKRTITTTNKWMFNVDYELEKQFRDYKNNALAFGRSNRNANGEYMNIGKSGGVIKTGAGLFEQMEVANTFFYSDFSLKLIEDALYDIASGKLDMKNRKFVVKTGERGAAQFNKAVMQTTSGWLPYVVNADNVGMVSRVKSPLHDNALSAGYQFVEYKAPNGLTLTIDVDPYYDDPVRNKIKHRNGGPAFSYRYDILDMGTMDQPNIFKCTVKGQSEYRGYQWGPFCNPFTGEINNMSAANDEDSATIHKKATLGICVLDPTRTLSLIPTELAG